MTERIHQLPGTLRIALSVARVSFSEILRDRILYNIGMLTLLVIAASVLGSQISSTITARVLSDFSWGASLLSCFAVALTQGASAISRELERRTLLVALARPIQRQQWLLGKFLGVAGVVVLNGALLFGATALVSRLLLGEEFWSVPLGTRLGASILIIIQGCVIAAMALFFSCFSTTSLAAVLTVGIYFVGSSVSQIRWLAVQASDPVSRIMLDGLALSVPNFELFQLSRPLTYGLPVDFLMVAGRMGYGVIWCGILVLLGGILLQRREL
jgi:Cu-processing system permease protein